MEEVLLKGLTGVRPTQSPRTENLKVVIHEGDRESCLRTFVNGQCLPWTSVPGTGRIDDSSAVSVVRE